MKSKARIGRHPIHPMLIPIPIGLWAAALACDLAFQATGDVFWYDAAWWAIAGGIGGALLAAIPGLIDYVGVAMHTPARGPAAVHMAMNLVLVGVYLTNLLLRADHGAVAGGAWGLAFAMEALAFAALGLSGWIGGELVYRFGLGMDREAMRVSMLEEDRVAITRDEDHVIR